MKRKIVRILSVMLAVVLFISNPYILTASVQIYSMSISDHTDHTDSGEQETPTVVDETGIYKRLEVLMERGAVTTTYNLSYSSNHYNNYVRSAFDIKTGGATRLTIEKFNVTHGTMYVQFFASDYTKISSVVYTDGAVVNIPSGCAFIRVEIATSAELETIAIRFYDCTGNPSESKRSGISEISEKLTYQVSDEIHTTSRLMLPPNYTTDGEKVPVILWLEGSGSSLSTWDGDFNANKLPYLQYLRDEGFAVFSVYAWGNEYAEKYPKCGNSFPYPIPINLDCIREGIEYICSRYNLDADNIHIMSKSQGGQIALYYASCNELNVQSIGMFAPVLDYLSMPGEAMYKDTRAAIAEELGFTGDVEYFASDRFLAYSEEGRAFLRENLDKLKILNEAWVNLTGAELEELFEASMDDCETFWTEEIWKTDRTDIYTHTEYVKTATVPVKIWGAADDAATPYLKMVEVVAQLKNGGSVAELATLPNGTGGHSCADGGSTRVDVTTALGIEHKNVPIGWVENVEWIRKYSATNEADTPDYEGKTIACIGDSITYAYGVTKDETDYVTLLAKKLGMNYIRLGQSGTTLCTDGSRTCNIDKLTESNLNGADVVTIAMGINDFCAAGADYYKLGDINSTDTSTIYGAMKMWCERIEELRKTDSLKNTEFYFLTPVITSWNNSVTSARDWDQSKKNVHGYTLRDLCNAIIEVAALYDVEIIDMNLLSGMYYVSAEDNNTAVFGGDGVHPGEVGHEMMANALANVLLKNDLTNDHDHTFGSWITTTWSSDCKGEQKRVCTVCCATESRNTSHSYTAVVTPPTCTEKGYTTYICACGDSYVGDYTDPITPKNYRWEIQNGVLVSVAVDGNTENNLTLTSGSVTNGALSNVRGTLQNAVTLYHNMHWAIEWRSSGDWEGMLLGSTLDSSVRGLTYLFRYAPMDLLALGEYTGTWDNYGLIHNIDMTASHVFRLENRVAADGSNAVYLIVDGVEIGVMNHYYKGGSDQNKTVNWANGKDIVFANIGTSSHPVNGMKLEYLQIWEGLDEHAHSHSYEAVVTPPTCTKQGYTTYTCACGESYVDGYTNALGHNFSNHACTRCGEILWTMNLYYDDHISVAGKIVEIIDAGRSTNLSAVVELKDNHLVAVGVGRARVRIEGETYEITVDKTKINLIMIMGQSNAGNHFPNATSDVTCPIGTAYWWGGGKGASATEPVPYTQSSMGFHAPLLAELYAQSVAAGDPVKNVLIWEEGVTAKNGQSIVKWAASASDTSGTDGAVTMLENCRAYYLANSDKYEIVGNGVYWIQGESDLTMDSTLYTQRFMAIWQRLKAAGMEYVAFLRVRRDTGTNSSVSDDLFYSRSLAAQLKMINENPEFYLATDVTENWIGKPTDEITLDISKYITMMEAYGQSATYTDAYGNTATFADGKLTTAMKSVYGSNNTCHYGKFGYGVIGADAAYNMYRALHAQNAEIVVTDTSGYADRKITLAHNETITLDISSKTDHLAFRVSCGSIAGTLTFIIRSGEKDITNRNGMIFTSGENYGCVNVETLRNYDDVTIELIYIATNGEVYTAICEIPNTPREPKSDYIWDFNEDLYARDDNGEIQNSLLAEILKGSYMLQDGYLIGNGLQMALEKAIELEADKNWSIEWKYGALNGGTAGFLLCSNSGNTVGNKAIWHTKNGNLIIADYADKEGYRNYTSADVIIKDYDCLRLANAYDPITKTSIISLYVNGELVIKDISLKGSFNDYHDKLDMTEYPLSADFSFNYLGNVGMGEFLMNCPLDYLKISFGEAHTHAYTATVTLPTCTEQGYTTYTCECGESYVDDYTEATGHKYENYTCKGCGYQHIPYVSILGDSISTYTGISDNAAFNTTLAGGAIYYTEGRYGVYQADTWWQQAIDALGMQLLVNNSWSGSCIWNTRYGTVGAYIDRSVQLHNNEGITPDIIAVYLGTNDFCNYKSTLGTAAAIDYASLIVKTEDGYTYAEPKIAAEAYAIMIHKATVRYPDAEIYCFTLLPQKLSDANVKLLEQFNQSILEIADHFGAYAVDLYSNSGIKYDSNFATYIADNSLHPGPAGMDAITGCFVSSILENSQYIGGEIRNITYNLDQVMVDQGTAYAVRLGDPFSCTLTAPNGYVIKITVTMNGVDITSSCYQDCKINVADVTGDITITASSAMPVKDAENYYWEFDGNELVSTGSSENDLTRLNGSIVNGVHSSSRYSLAERIVLYHDRPWILEWKSEGTWTGTGAGALLFSGAANSATVGSFHLYRRRNNEMIALGTYNGSKYLNYGVKMSEYNIDCSAEHVYRLENRIAADGSNMIWLYVDGVEIGPMNQYGVDGVFQNTTSDYLSGKDFVFTHFGGNAHPINNCSIDYIAVWENGHTHTYVAEVTAPTCTERGYTTYTCECGDSYVADYTEARHQYQSGICGVCGAKADPYLQQLPKDILGCSNLYDLLTPTKGYYTATKYDASNGAVLSVVIPVEPGDRISASSFGPKSQNMGSVDGIRMTYLLDGVIVLSLSAGDVYNAYMRDGYITVPEGVNMVCIPWWKPDRGNTLLLSQISKNYAIHSPASVPAQAPTCTEKGYTAGEICEICNISLSARTEIPAAGHSYSGDICTVCGMLDLRVILNGKYVSILGDSISTFAGYSNDANVNTTIGGNAPRYQAGAADTKPGSYCLLESVNDTWWMQFANQTGMNLLVNNSWAGSQVFGGQTSDGRVIPAAYLERCLNLHDNTLENNPNLAPINPDIIFVYLGINDYNFNRGNVGSGEIDYAKLIREDGTYVTPTTFGEAYAIMLHKAKQAYPNAQIFAMTLLPENLYSVDMAAWEQHNAYIRAAAEYYGIPVVDLAANCAITWDNYSGYMIDKIHPTTEGMKLISDCIGAELSDYYKETCVQVQEYIRLNGTAMWLVTANRNGAVDKISGKTYTYNGQKMYWSSKYRAYCYLVVAETLSVEEAKATIDDMLVDADAIDIAYNMDVNNSGKVDANDAQLVYNMYQAKAYNDFGTVDMLKFLKADLNDSVGVDSTDVQVIISSLLKVAD